jgi:hypothetical protein
MNIDIDWDSLKARKAARLARALVAAHAQEQDVFYRVLTESIDEFFWEADDKRECIERATYLVAALSVFAVKGFQVAALTADIDPVDRPRVTQELIDEIGELLADRG